MIQNLSFTPIRNTVPLNSNFSPMPQSGSGISFRDVLASNLQSSIAVAVSSGSQRDSILDAINQARVLTPSAFTGTPAGAVREAFDIRKHYSMPPEDVKSKLDKLEEEIRNSHYIRMSDSDIYHLIENKFIEAFGEDFMIGFNLLQNVPGAGMFNNPDGTVNNSVFIEIGRSFNDLVSSKIGIDEMHKVNRERLYGNKSDMEIVDAIIAKHPQRLTNRCLASITSEMYAVGLPDNIGFSKYVDLLFERYGDSSMSEWSDFEEVWNRLLSKPADVQEMAFMHNGALRDEGKNPFVIRVRDILVKLGAKLGPNGYFLDPNGEPFIELDVTFGSLDSDDLFDEFREDLEQHDENLHEARELLEKKGDVIEAGVDMSTRMGEYIRTVASQYRHTNRHNTIDNR